MELIFVQLSFPEDANIIFGQSHFIKTVEDLHEIMVGTSAAVKFGLAFCEASGERLIRHSGNDDGLREIAIKNADLVSAGHTFIIVMRNAYPVNFLNAVKACPEVCRIFCATANAVQVVLAVTKQGRGVMGVIDGESPLGIEGDKDIEDRKKLLRTIGYKL